MPKELTPENYTVESAELYVPDLNDIAKAFSLELPKNFKFVDTSVTKCPDLTEPPFNLAGKGLSGSECLVEIGGPAYLLPVVQKDKIYNLKHLSSLTGTSYPCFIIGAGAGPWPHLGVNSEMITNLLIKDDVDVDNLTKIGLISTDSSDKPILKTLPSSETRACLLANLFCSNGNTGTVIKVHCKDRIGKHDFITSLRLALIAVFPDKPIGIGGAFLINQGKAKHHVMPDFSKVPINSDTELDNWLRYFEFSAPMVEVGTLISHDPGLSLRMQHFHGFGNEVAGHYHYDTTPDTVEYIAYLSVASKIYRVDKPSVTSTFGAD